MKKLLFLLLSVFILISCEKDQIVDPEPEVIFEISLDGVAFDPYERYAVINTYGAVKDVDGFSKRADAMIQVEKLMANAVGEETSLGLATQVNIDPPENDFVYPQFDATSDGTTATVQGQQTEISPEEQESKKQLRIKTDIRKGVEADVAAAKGVKEKIELYKDISKEDIVKTGEKEALLEQTKTDTKTKLRSVQREEQKKKN